MITTRNKLRAFVASAIAVPVLVFGLAACAGPDETKDSAPTGGAKSSSETAGDPYMEWQMDFAECMRAQGVDVPDPEQGKNGVTMSKVGEEIDPAAYEAASDVCMEELGDPPAMSPEAEKAGQEAFLEEMKKAAECYREKGYDMPDPSAEDKTIQMPSDVPDDVAAECGGGMASKAQ